MGRNPPGLQILLSIYGDGEIVRCLSYIAIHSVGGIFFGHAANMMIIVYSVFRRGLLVSAWA